MVNVFKQEPAPYTQWPKGADSEYSCYGSIRCTDDDDDDIISYAMQAAEAAHIVLDGGRTVYVDFVGNRGYGDTITIGFSKQAYVTLKQWKGQRSGFECDVKFELKHSYFHRQHEALDALPPHVIEKLLPASTTKNYDTPSISKASDIDLELDYTGQMQALKAILNKGNDSVIIAGPFGTGKTRVLARATYELLRQNRSCKILICAHHQVSADTFIEYFGKAQFFFKQIRFFRVALGTYKSNTKDKFPKCYTGVRQVLSRNPQVIVCTLGLSHHLKALTGLTHIFIDEAAQTRETEAIIPLQLAEPHTKIVLAGDHCQVVIIIYIRSIRAT